MYKVEKTLLCRTVFAVVLLAVFSAVQLRGQNIDALSSYSPYSLFGVGKMFNEGSAYNYSMGGIGIGMRDNRVINFVNPASITARDTLAFMFDFGINEKNQYFNDSHTKSAYNIFNMQNIAFTFPIYKSSAFIVGIAPFSDVGYKFQSTEMGTDMVADMGDIKYQQYGTGSIYQLFFGGAVMFFDRISIGAQAIYYFGYMNKHNDILFNSSSSYSTVLTGYDFKVHGFSGKFGLQYIQPFEKNNSQLVIGGTYRLGTDMRGDIARYAYASSDTIMYNNVSGSSPLRIADEYGVGLSYRVNSKWAVGADFIQQNWHKASFPDQNMFSNFSASAARYYKAGFEITPNMYDIRYYMKRVTYRAGAYYEQSYLKVNGHQVNAFGITFGASFPIFRWHNAVSVAVDIGQRGTLRHNLVRERYVNFIVNINLHDVWFVKYRYD